LRAQILAAGLLALCLTPPAQAADEGAPVQPEVVEQAQEDSAGAPQGGVSEKAAQAWETTREGTSRAAEYTYEKAGDAWEATREGTGRAIEWTREKSSSVWEATKEGAGTAAEWTREKTGAAWEATREAAGRTGDAVKQGYEKTKEKAGDMVGGE